MNLYAFVLVEAQRVRDERQAASHRPAVRRMTPEELRRFDAQIDEEEAERLAALRRRYARPRKGQR